MKQSQRVAKNTASGIFAAVAGGMLQFVSIFIVAHFLGVRDFGIFNYLLAFATVFQFMADFGLSNILVREMTKRPGELERLLGAGKMLLWLLFGGAVLAMMLILACLHLSPETKLLSLIMGLAYLLLLHSVSYIAVLRATEEMEYNAIGFVLQRTLLVVFLLVALSMQLGLWGVVWCHFLANLFQWAFYHWIVTMRNTRGKLRWDPPLWKTLILETLPLGGGIALRQFAWQLDIFLLTYFTNADSVGLFSGPFRIVTGLTLLSAVLSVPLFPLFVRLAHDSRPELAAVYQRTVKWFCLISCPIMAACLAAPRVWIHLFLGEKFYAAVPVLQILSLAIVPVFISVLYPFLYSALHIQKWFLATMAAVVAARLALGCWVIPRYGYLGECVVIAAIEIVLFMILAGHLSRMDIPVGLKNNLAKPILASSAMGLVLFIAGNSGVIWTIFVAVLGGVLYLGVLAVLRTFTREELALAREASGFLKTYWIAGRLKRGIRI
ncbi:MAG TPA: oligosaccharide flippase family protein [Candidatus Methylacidiphilales bacterium]|nr:oligosaccharide flippase family protein [Candidatus Methylacidiphilales bacterium]